METIKNPGAAIILMGILIGLTLGIYNGFEDNYGVESTDLQEGKTVIQRLNDLNLIQGMEKLTEGIAKLVTPANPLDLVGGLAAAATGTLQTIGGIVTFIPDIFLIIIDYYVIPSPITVGIGAIFSMYLGFLILSAYLRHRV